MRARVYELARHLNMNSKEILRLCNQRGLPLLNQLSAIHIDDADKLAECLDINPAVVREIFEAIIRTNVSIDNTASEENNQDSFVQPCITQDSLDCSTKIDVSRPKPPDFLLAKTIRTKNTPDINPRYNRLYIIATKFNLYELLKCNNKDPEDIVIIFRKSIEKILRRVLNHPRLRLKDAITLIEQRKLLSAKCIAQLHYVRSMGNIASHENEEFTDQDIDHLAYAIECILKEICQKGLFSG